MLCLRVDAINSIALGVQTYTTANNQIVIGNISIAQTLLRGNVGIWNNYTVPTARLHLPAGTATASTAPLKFTAGTNLTTPENGAVEYANSTLYFTRADAVREIIPTIVTKADTGDPGSAVEGLICINTYDNTLKIYADGGWRQLATW